MGEKRMIRFGILGCGTVAQIHAQAIALLENACLAGAAGTSADSARKFTQLHGGRAYDSFAQMLADDTVDVVCICTPSFCHVQQATAALEHSKHVVLEKPMALNTADADKIIKAASESDTLLTVVFQNRFVPDVRRAKEIVDSGVLGDLVFCDLSMKYWRDPEYYASSNWRGTFKHDGGGALINQGIHGVDMLLYIVGDADVRSANVKTSYHKIEVEDTVVALLDFKNGATGTLHASTCAYPGFNRRIEIIGTKGCLILSEGRIERFVVGNETLIDGNVEKRGASADHTVMDTSFHGVQLQNLINAVHGKEPLFIDGKEGRRALALIEKIYSYR